LVWLWGGVYWEWCEGVTEVGVVDDFVGLIGLFLGNMGYGTILMFWGVKLWCWGEGA